jgi:hypothetical protein
MILTLINLHKNFFKKALPHLAVFIGICSIVLVYGWRTFDLSPEELINKYITETIPQSMSGMKGVIEYPAIDHVIRITFNINQKDFNKYILNSNYKPSNDDFPYTLPIIEKLKWWKVRGLKEYQQFKGVFSNGIHYIWHDPSKDNVYFLRVRSQMPKDASLR